MSEETVPENLGTSFEAKVDRIVDGDTIRVFLDPAGDKSESLRILSLDTEEVHVGSKPVTPMGKRASARAQELIKPGDTVRLLLPGDDPLEQAMQRYRGNFGRLLTYVFLQDGRDFQEIMIREGYTPYFQKYGYANYLELHEKYITAEKEAQAENRGIWNQLENNGAVIRNYAALGTWWDLRARTVQDYRRIKRQMPDANLLNTRLDYDRLLELAKAGAPTTVFIEIRSSTPVASDHVVFNTGSLSQPFQIFVPNANIGEGADIMNLLDTRYRSDGEDRPRRSYAYITGEASMFPDTETGRPQIIVTETAQISDWPSNILGRDTIF